MGNNITIIRVHVSMEIVCNIIARVRHIIDAIFGAAYLIAFILLAVGCGHNKWI